MSTIFNLTLTYLDGVIICLLIIFLCLFLRYFGKSNDIKVLELKRVRWNTFNNINGAKHVVLRSKAVFKKYQEYKLQQHITL